MPKSPEFLPKINRKEEEPVSEVPQQQEIPHKKGGILSKAGKFLGFTAIAGATLLAPKESDGQTVNYGRPDNLAYGHRYEPGSNNGNYNNRSYDSRGGYFENGHYYNGGGSNQQGTVPFVAGIVHHAMDAHERHVYDVEHSEAMQILKDRYARGEITREEYEDMHRELLK